MSDNEQPVCYTNRGGVFVYSTGTSTSACNPSNTPVSNPVSVLLSLDVLLQWRPYSCQRKFTVYSIAYEGKVVFYEGNKGTNNGCLSVF